VLDKRVADRDFLAGDYSIADMACWPWMRNPASAGIDVDEFPNAKAWFARIAARPAVIAAAAEGDAMRAQSANLAASGAVSDKGRDILFGQRARK
jgi:GST-like protein